ncbi:Membrane protein OS=Cellulomonas persica OX=76861 GN=CPE01_02990 PE=4 SV=1 [Cellulomonas persica]|uniref:Membrane protein n=2 Tax=Cellulomonas persica TaxID=76861 RepID=A0A510UQ12_9CELL|nr:membrane protein [Cellulomonas persica]
MLAGMVVVAAVLALLSAVLHVVIFVLEAVLFRRPDVHRRFATKPQDVDAVAPWAFNQGFYNLFLAIGAAAGALLALGEGTRTVGLGLVLLACGSMLAAAIVLAASDRRMLRAAANQGTIPLVTVVAAVLALA